MRWLLLKDLTILRRSPLLVGLLVLYPIVISVLMGLALSAGPDKPAVAVLKRPAFSNCVFCDYHRICPTSRDQIRERKKEEAGADLHQRLALQ